MSTNNLIYTSAAGLNTVVDPIRLPFDPDTGVSGLAAAVNVTIDDTGFISRRKGYKQVFSDSCHSIFCDGGDCLFIREGDLCQLMPDYSVVILKTGLSIDKHMSYAQVNNDIYYTNGIDIGIVRKGGIIEDWVANDYVGEKTNKHFDGPRAGNHIAYFNGCMLVAEHDVLWVSEPYALSWYNRQIYVPFLSKIRMVKPVTDGVFISDKKNTYFLRGGGSKEWKLIKVANYPAIEWSDAIDYIEGFEIGLQEFGPCALWSSLEGACLGTPSGNFVNLNKKTVIYPDRGTWGASLVKGYHLIHTIDVGC